MQSTSAESKGSDKDEEEDDEEKEEEVRGKKTSITEHSGKQKRGMKKSLISTR